MQEPVKKQRHPHRGRIDTYRKTDITTANRETILLMMYAGGIRFLKQAMQAAENNDLAEKNRLVGKAQQVVSELRATLNFEVGGQIASRLETLYHFITERLMTATAEKTIEPLREALEILLTLNSAWEEAIASIRKEKSLAPDKP